MAWTNDHQQRLNHLRKQELIGTLTDDEQAELTALMTEVESEEARTLAATMDQLRFEVQTLEREIVDQQVKSEQQARLLARQQALVADGRRFLAEFEQRRASIVDGLARLANGVLAPT